MLHHPDTLRPGSAAAPFLGSPPPLEDDGIVAALATVILRQAGDGQATEIRHFHEAEETRALSDDEIARHIGAARRRADRKVIRQDAVDVFPSPQRGEGDTRSVRGEGLLDADARDPSLTEKTDEELLALAEGTVLDMVGDAAIACALLRLGMTPAAVSRIWDRLMIRVATKVAKLDKPSLGSLAAQRAQLQRGRA